MDPDYITDLVEENRALQSRLVEMKEGWRSQVAELEEELRQLKDDLRRALHRKVEEVSTPSCLRFVGMGIIDALIGWKTQTDEGVPPEEIIHRIQNRAKKEETTGSDLGITAAEHKVKIKHEIKPRELVRSTHLFRLMNGKIVDLPP